MFVILAKGHCLSKASWVWNPDVGHYLSLNAIMCYTWVMKVMILGNRLYNGVEGLFGTIVYKYMVDKLELLSHNWIEQIALGKWVTRHPLALEESHKIMFKVLLIVTIHSLFIGCRILWEYSVVSAQRLNEVRGLVI